MRRDHRVGVGRRRPLKTDALRAAFRVEGRNHGPEERTLPLRAVDQSFDDFTSGPSAFARPASDLRRRWQRTDEAEGAIPDEACGAACESHIRRRSHPPAHVLFALGDAWSTGEGDTGTTWPSGSVDDAAVHALEPGRPRRSDQAARRPAAWRHFGDGRWYESVKSVVRTT